MKECVSRLCLLFLPTLMLLVGYVSAKEESEKTQSETTETSAADVKEFDLPKQAINSILVFKRDDGGQGTGFIVKREVAGKERFFVYTNQHVIAGCKAIPKAFRADGSAVPLGRLITAVNYDLAIFMLENAEPNFLEIQPEVDQKISVGEPIGTPGNAGGASAITFKFGKVVAIGPELVEIDAMIKGGNSGGPILHSNGRVIGIVSFFREETLDDDRVTGADKEKVVRRFGYRVDNVKSWETPDWKRFVMQGERVSRVESTSKDLLQLVNSRFKTWNGNEQIGKIMGSFEKNAESARSQQQFYGDVSKAFTELKKITLTDLNTAEADPALYWWWKHNLIEERRLRKELDEAFEKQAAEARQKR